MNKFIAVQNTRRVKNLRSIKNTTDLIISLPILHNGYNFCNFEQYIAENIKQQLQIVQKHDIVSNLRSISNSQAYRVDNRPIIVNYLKYYTWLICGSVRPTFSLGNSLLIKKRVGHCMHLRKNKLFRHSLHKPGLRSQFSHGTDQEE